MWWALLIIAADGSTSIGGPYRSEEKARTVGDQQEREAPGLTADVYEMEPL